MCGKKLLCKLVSEGSFRAPYGSDRMKMTLYLLNGYEVSNKNPDFPLAKLGSYANGGSRKISG